MLRAFEDVAGASILYEPTGTFLQSEQADIVRDAAGLGKIVGDDNDAVADCRHLVRAHGSYKRRERRLFDVWT